MVRSKSKTKARMIETTTKLLELQGYHATGLNQVIRESATPKGSLYFHFPEGKEQLAAAAVLTAGVQISKKIEKALDSGDTVGEAIAAFVLTIACELKDSDFRKGCPVATVAMETAVTNNRLRLACEQVYASWFALVEQRLIQADFSAAEAKSWTTFVWAAIEGALLLSRTRRSLEPLETVAQQFKVLIQANPGEMSQKKLNR